MQSIIAIDGYVAAGKGTIATGVAQRLGWQYLDTGAMFRALSLSLLRYTIDTSNPDEVADHLQRVNISFTNYSNTINQDVLLDGENVEDEIRTPRVSGHIGTFVAYPRVRDWMCEQWRAIARTASYVVDGRDMGTVVFPDAPLKIFVIADPHVRAQRRYDQMQAKGVDVTLDDILQDIHRRDNHDYLGENATCTRAADARILDTTPYTIDQQLDIVLQWAKECGLSN